MLGMERKEKERKKTSKTYGKIKRKKEKKRYKEIEAKEKQL